MNIKSLAPLVAWGESWVIAIVGSLALSDFRRWRHELDMEIYREAVAERR